MARSRRLTASSSGTAWSRARTSSSASALGNRSPGRGASTSAVGSPPPAPSSRRNRCMPRMAASARARVDGARPAAAMAARYPSTAAGVACSGSVPFSARKRSYPRRSRRYACSVLRARPCSTASQVRNSSAVALSASPSSTPSAHRDACRRVPPRAAPGPTCQSPPAGRTRWALRLYTVRTSVVGEGSARQHEPEHGLGIGDLLAPHDGVDVGQGHLLHGHVGLLLAVALVVPVAEAGRQVQLGDLIAEAGGVGDGGQMLQVGGSHAQLLGQLAPGGVLRRLAGLVAGASGNLEQRA